MKKPVPKLKTHQSLLKVLAERLEAELVKTPQSEA